MPKLRVAKIKGSTVYYQREREREREVIAAE